MIGTYFWIENFAVSFTEDFEFTLNFCDKSFVYRIVNKSEIEKTHFWDADMSLMSFWLLNFQPKDVKSVILEPF